MCVCVCVCSAHSHPRSRNRPFVLRRSRSWSASGGSPQPRGASEVEGRRAGGRGVKQVAPIWRTPSTALRRWGGRSRLLQVGERLPLIYSLLHFELRVTIYPRFHSQISTFFRNVTWGDTGFHVIVYLFLSSGLPYIHAFIHRLLRSFVT